MAKVAVPFTCPGCKTVSTIPFLKPKYFTPTRYKWSCPECQSRFFLFIKRQKASDPKTVYIEVAALDLSDKAIKLLEEELKLKEKPNVTAEVSAITEVVTGSTL